MTETEKRILVVDDDDAIRALLATILRRRGFKVDTARNGEEALERVKRCRYAVLLLDLMMPRMSGHQFLEEMAGFTPEERPLIIVLTAGMVPRAQLPDFVAASMRKPFDIEMLVDTVAACASTRPQTAQVDDCREEHETLPSTEN